MRAAVLICELDFRVRPIVLGSHTANGMPIYKHEVFCGFRGVGGNEDYPAAANNYRI
jgi:hypothetical protein